MTTHLLQLLSVIDGHLSVARQGDTLLGRNHGSHVVVPLDGGVAHENLDGHALEDLVDELLLLKMYVRILTQGSALLYLQPVRVTPVELSVELVVELD